MISVILIEPEIPGNIGAVARAVKNFGCSSLILVNPKCDHLCDEARDRASHAGDVLRNAKVKDYSVLESFDYLAATTSKLGKDYNIPRVAISPAQLSEKLGSISRKTRLGLVFGRESYGLSNEEIMKCDFAVSIPCSGKYPAMNLSHAVAVMLYELCKSREGNSRKESITPIGAADKRQILRIVDSILDRLEFSTKEKKETQKKVWKRMIGKSFMTRREAFALMGFLKKVNRDFRDKDRYMSR